jgi:hypothetical protein
MNCTEQRAHGGFARYGYVSPTAAERPPRFLSLLHQVTFDMQADLLIAYLTVQREAATNNAAFSSCI